TLTGGLVLVVEADGADVGDVRGVGVVDGVVTTHAAGGAGRRALPGEVGEVKAEVVAELEEERTALDVGETAGGDGSAEVAAERRVVRRGLEVGLLQSSAGDDGAALDAEAERAAAEVDHLGHGELEPDGHAERDVLRDRQRWSRRRDLVHPD